MSRFRRGSLVLGAVGLLMATVVGRQWIEDRRLPRYQGRSVRVWFHELCRHESGWAHADESRVLESKMALVTMGTNAIPFLLDEAFRDRVDGPFRTNLHELFRDLPAWLGGGGFRHGTGA